MASDKKSKADKNDKPEVSTENTISPIDQFFDEIAERDTHREDMLLTKDKVSIDVDSDSGRPILILGGKNKEEYSLTDHAQNQLLAHLKIPINFYPKMSADLRKKVASEMLAEAGLLTYQTYDQTVIGVQGSRSLPPRNVVLVEAFKEAKEEYENEHEEKLDFEVISTHLDTQGLQLRAVFPHTKQEPAAVGDVYCHGFHVQMSEVKAADFIQAPLSYRLVCSNGMIDSRVQNALVKQRAISIQKDAFKILLVDMFNWHREEASKGIFEALGKLHSEGKEYNFPMIEKLLPKVTAKLGGDIAGVYVTNVLTALPAGMAENRKISILAYDLFQIFTNKAKQLPWAHQAQVEKNVATVLLEL